MGKEWFLSDLETRQFDVITACEVIEHLPNPRETFTKLRGRLKSPGVFAFQTGQWDPKLLGRDWWYLGPQTAIFRCTAVRGWTASSRKWAELIDVCGLTIQAVRHGCSPDFIGTLTVNYLDSLQG